MTSPIAVSPNSRGIHGVPFGIVAATLIVLFGGVGEIAAQDAISLENESAQPVIARDPEGFWTPTRLQGAQALELPLPANSPQNIEDLEITLESLTESVEDVEEQQSEFRDGASPIGEFEVAPDLVDMLYQPAATASEMVAAESGVVPFDEGTKRAPFTSARIHRADDRLFYPYRTAGKLFFRTRGGRDSWCSAAVLRPRIILTAGHCVHQGSGGANGWFSRWVFVPGYHNGQAPFQAWNWRWVITTGSWANSNGSVPNRADFAIIELEDRKFGTQFRKVGEVTGYLGYHTNVLSRNHVKIIGFPGNHDRGEIMHHVNTGSFRSGGSNTILYGSDMRGGSSGGPWIMNFGNPAQGQTGGLRPWRNRVVGVTSYGYIATGPKVQGSSILNQEFLDILNRACNHRAGNC